MTSSKTPIKLKENIIVDVIFEIRFDAEQGFSELIPGVSREVFGQFKALDKFPIAEMPLNIRAQDPGLKYHPTTRIEWEELVLVVGEHTIGVGFSTNYPGWDKFKEFIFKLLEGLRSSSVDKMIKRVSRYSLKYVDFIPTKLYSDLDRPFTVEASVGALDISNTNKRLQLESQQDFGVVLFDYTSFVDAQIERRERDEGALITVDVMRGFNEMTSWEDFLIDLETHKESMHSVSKEFVFNAFSQELLVKLGAEYDYQ